MGSPLSEAGRSNNEQQRRREIGRSFAVATKAVTVGHWKQFLKERPRMPDYSPEDSPEESCPINGVNWFMAAAYCNWLSKKEGVPREQWCYPEKIGEGMKMEAGYLKRRGYRLATEAEWEIAAGRARRQAGTTDHRRSCCRVTPGIGEQQGRAEPGAELARGPEEAKLIWGCSTCTGTSDVVSGQFLNYPIGILERPRTIEYFRC